MVCIDDSNTVVFLENMNRRHIQSGNSYPIDRLRPLRRSPVQPLWSKYCPWIYRINSAPMEKLADGPVLTTVLQIYVGISGEVSSRWWKTVTKAPSVNSAESCWCQMQNDLPPRILRFFRQFLKIYRQFVRDVIDQISKSLQVREELMFCHNLWMKLFLFSCHLRVLFSYVLVETFRIVMYEFKVKKCQTTLFSFPFKRW